ncbi:MAG: MarR family winged helix-turn-helix transcriptional regulator [Nocardioidaceae bacterium]
MTRWLSASQQQAWRSYLLGTTLLADRLDRDLRDKHGLSMAEYEILVRLSESPNRALRMAEVADSVKNSRSRITHTVQRLESSGFVVRRSCASDGRGVIAVLTDDGFSKLAAAAPDHVESVRTSLIDGLSDEDVAVIGRVFGTVAERLGTDAAVGAMCSNGCHDGTSSRPLSSAGQGGSASRSAS